MNTKFTFSWIVAILVAVVIGALVFFSSYFSNEGSTTMPLILTAGVLAVLFVINIFLVKAKTCHTISEFKKNSVVELVLLGVTLVAIMAVILLSNQFFTVMDRQAQIEEKVNAQVKQMDDMFANYQKNVDDRVAFFQNELNAAESNKKYDQATYIKYRLDRLPKETLLVDFRSDISCDETKSEIDEWTKKYQHNSSKLQLFVLMGQVNSVSVVMNETKGKLQQLDQAREEGRNGEAWDYTEGDIGNIMPLFTEKGSISIFAILASLLLVALFLSPYWFTPRDGRSRGLFDNLKRGNDSGNGKSPYTVQI